MNDSTLENTSPYKMHLQQRNMIKQQRLMKLELDKVDRILQTMSSQKEQLLQTKLLIIQKIKKQLMNSGKESVYLDAFFDNNGNQKVGVIVLPEGENENEEHKDKEQGEMMIQMVQEGNLDSITSPVDTEKVDIISNITPQNLVEEENKQNQISVQQNPTQSEDKLNENHEQTASSLTDNIYDQSIEKITPSEEQNSNKMEIELENADNTSNKTEEQIEMEKTDNTSNKTGEQIEMEESIPETEINVIQPKDLDNSQSVSQTQALDFRNKAFKSAPTKRQENNTKGSLLQSEDNENQEQSAQILRQTHESCNSMILSDQSRDDDIRNKINKLISQAPCLQNQELLKRQGFFKSDARNQGLQQQHSVFNARISRAEFGRGYESTQKQSTNSQKYHQGQRHYMRQSLNHVQGFKKQSQSRDKVSLIPSQNHYHHRLHSPFQCAHINNQLKAQTTNQSKSFQAFQGQQIQNQVLSNQDRRQVNHVDSQIPRSSTFSGMIPQVTDQKSEIISNRKVVSTDIDGKITQKTTKEIPKTVNQVEITVPVIPEPLDLSLKMSSQIVSKVFVDKEPQIRDEIKDMQTQTNQEVLIQQVLSIIPAVQQQLDDNTQIVLEINSETSSSLDSINLVPDGNQEPLINVETISDQRQTIHADQLQQSENISIPGSSLISKQPISPLEIIDLSEITPQSNNQVALNTPHRQDQFQEHSEKYQPSDKENQYCSPPNSKDNQNIKATSPSPQDQMSNSGSTQPSQDEDELPVEIRINQIEQRLIKFIREGSRNQEQVLKYALSLRAEMNLSKVQMAISQKWYISFSKRFNIDIE